MPWLAPGIALLVVLGGAFAATATYSRTERVQGVLIPSEGALTVASLRGGVVSEVHVTEGQRVTAGAPLMTVALDSRTETGRLGDLVTRAADDRRDAREREGAARLELIARDGEDIAVKRKRLVEELNLAREQEALVRQTLAMAEGTLAAGRTAHENGFISSVRYRQWEADVLQAKLALISVRQRITTAERDREQVEVAARRNAAEMAQAEASRAMARAEDVERRLGLKDQRTVVVSAERTGRIASLDVRLGDIVAPSQSLGVLLPEGSRIMAELWAPSQSVGFIRTGNSVKLMFDSFPYRQYGTAQGQVVSVSRAPARQGPSQADGNAPPLYRVMVKIDRQAIRAYGQDWGLTPGSTLSALVVLQRRSVLGWVLEPLRRAGSQVSA